jgi:geranylgeranylglycerol-phosphate geranylgeranyltransferase
MIAAFLPSLVFALVYFLSETWPIALNDVFLMLAALTVGLQLWTGVLFYNYPEGAMTYYALSFNFRACACAEAALIALFNPMLGILMFFLTYVLVGFLFNFHVNRRG